MDSAGHNFGDSRVSRKDSYTWLIITFLIFFWILHIFFQIWLKGATLFCHIYEGIAFFGKMSKSACQNTKFWHQKFKFFSKMAKFLGQIAKIGTQVDASVFDDFMQFLRRYCRKPQGGSLDSAEPIHRIAN